MSDASPTPELLINRFARAVATYEAQAEVQRFAAERLTELMGQHFHVLAPRLLEIGCGTGLLTRRLMARFAPSELVLNDLCPDMAICFANVPRTRFLSGDARTLVWPGPFDAIASASAVQWFGDLNAFSERCAAALPRGGLLAVSAFGPETLREISALTGRGLRYADFEAFVSAFDAFETRAAERTLRTLTFPDATAVLRHLRETGVTATGGGDTPWTRARLAAFSADYARRFPRGGGVALTYEPFWFVGVRR